MSHQDVTNPDTVSPASQSFPPPPHPTPPPQTVGLPSTSSGELQLPSSLTRPLSRKAAPTGRGLPANSSGEVQRIDLRPTDVATPTSTGLPANVSADTRTPGIPVTVFVR